MDGKTAGSRKRIGIVALLTVVGTVPLAGCAVPQTVAESLPAWMRPWQAPPAAAAQRASAPANPGGETTVHNDLQPTAYTEVARSQAPFGGRAGTGTVIHANIANFDDQVLKSDVAVLVDFYASWCGPCKRLAPTLDEVAAETPGVRVVKVNVDDSPELAERYDIHSMPSLLVFKNGRVVARQKGVVSRSRLIAMLDL